MASPVYFVLGCELVRLEILGTFFVAYDLNVSVNLSKSIRWASRDFLEARTSLGSLIEPDFRKIRIFDLLDVPDIGTESSDCIAL